MQSTSAPTPTVLQDPAEGARDPSSGGPVERPIQPDQAEGERRSDPAAPSGDARSGLVAGGRGGPDDELLVDGQEEVFSRTEVENGQIEHHAQSGGSRSSSTD